MSEILSIKRTIKYGSTGEDVKIVQRALKSMGWFGGAIGGNFLTLSEQAAKDFQAAHGLKVDGEVGPITRKKIAEVLGEDKAPPSPDDYEKPQSPTKKTTPVWMIRARSMLGKKETDSKFNKEMSAKWSLFGMNLGTIAKSWAAWCGLFVAVVLSGTGYNYATNGALARNWGLYGQKIEWKVNGIPEGAIIHVNPKSCSSGASNHVTFANGDCSVSDINKPGATFGGLGGNQSNQVKVSIYKASTICAVRWPTGAPMPEKVNKSLNCTGTGPTDESTR